MIDKISFKNYKIFRNRQTLTLKPITILIGKNNTGKTAIARLPTMIANSLSGEILNRNAFSKFCVAFNTINS